MQKTDGSCPILEFGARSRIANVKNFLKRHFVLQKPVHKKISCVFMLRVGFFPTRV